MEALTTEIERLRDQDPAIVDPASDQVLQAIEALFEGRVAPRPSLERVRERVIEFMTYRKPNQVPPGYLDARKPTPMHEAGDYLLWCEVLEHSATSPNQPVLLVTDDVKEDWYVRGDKAPRPELLHEFSEYSSAGYHQVTLSAFVRLVTQHVRSAVVDAVVVEELDQARRESTADYNNRASSFTRWSSAPGLRFGPVEFERLTELWQEAVGALEAFYVDLVVSGLRHEHIGQFGAARHLAKDVAALMRSAVLAGELPDEDLYRRVRRLGFSLRKAQDRAEPVLTREQLEEGEDIVVRFDAMAQMIGLYLD